MTKPLKPATAISQQVQLLRERGMEVDTDLARQWLNNVSYYRLSAYWYPARLMQPNGKRSDNFTPGTSFTNAVNLYEADRKLRTLVHDGMERIEVTMRTRIGEVLCSTNPLAYTQADQFRPGFNHQHWLDTAHKRVARAARNNAAIQHYRDEYNQQYPFWVLAEVLDFSDISRLYEGLSASKQREIAEGLGIRPNLSALSKNQQHKTKLESPLVRWMEHLTIIRNICAHHGRLWNKSFTPVPTSALRTQPEFARLPEGQNEKIYGALVVMSGLLRVVSPGTSWPDKISQLIQESFLTNPIVEPSSLGMPKTHLK